MGTTDLYFIPRPATVCDRDCSASAAADHEEIDTYLYSFFFVAFTSLLTLSDPAAAGSGQAEVAPPFMSPDRNVTMDIIISRLN